MSNSYEYMGLAISLAKKGLGYTNPNPIVGAVIVKNGEIIGSGYHKKCGDLHAERNALASCISSPEDGTLYVTLEPCCHYGRTSACTEAIIQSKIRKVVVGSTDPNPLVSGKGIAKLQEAGITVVTGFMKEECDNINKTFFHYISTKTPYVTMKYAMTIDGKIASYTGKSQWITCMESREHVQRQRHINAGIMVGINTVLQDDPLLTCRLSNGKNPLRIICDTALRTPLGSKIVKTAKEIPTIIATSISDAELHRPYNDAGIKIIVIEKKDGHLNLNGLMTELAKENIDSILLEGGGTLNWSALECGIVNKIQAYIAPKILGGSLSPSPVDGCGFDDPNNPVNLKIVSVEKIGHDILIESEVVKCLQE